MSLKGLVIVSAGLAATGAVAADLPASKAAPAEYVRVCTAYGAGFFYIPGSDVCLKVGGHARYQVEVEQPFNAGNSVTGTRSQARIELDARNPTAYGTLRAFVRLDVAYRTGAERSGSATRTGYAFDAGAGGTTPILAQDSGAVGRAQTQVLIEKAFVQWGGLIAGRTNSLFEFNKSTQFIGVLPFSNLTNSANVLGYILTLDSGFYASLSLEDAIVRRQSLTDPFNPAGTVAYYAGFRMPDIVGVIGVSQAWGSAQISGAIHQIPVVGATPAVVDSKYGFALLGGVSVNLPWLGNGDYLWAVVSYAKGGTGYVHSDWNPLASNNASFGNSRAFYQADAYINVNNNAVSLSDTWGIAAQLQHYWTPTLRSGFFGGYSQFNNPTIGTATGSVSIADWDYWAAGANLIWSPVRALDIGGEVAYQHIRGRNVQTLNGVPAAGTVQSANLKNADGAWIARFRVQRSF